VNTYTFLVDGSLLGTTLRQPALLAVTLNVDSTSTPTSVNQPRKVSAELTFDGRASAAVGALLGRTAATAEVRMVSVVDGANVVDGGFILRAPKFRSVKHFVTTGGVASIVLRVEATALEVKLVQPKLPSAISLFVIG